MQQKQKKTLGLALGSGGVKGLVHVGVIKTLIKHQIKIDYLAGTSIGAWVAANYALYQDLDKLADFTLGKKKEKLLTFLEPTLRGGIIRGKKLQKLLDAWLQNADFADLKIPLKIVATDLISGQPVILEKGNVATAIRASMAIPTMFKPVEIDDLLLVDGGVSNPVPDNIVKQMGADVVLAVNLDNYQVKGIFSKDKVKLIKTAHRSLDIIRHYLAEYSIQKADIIIKPTFKDFGMVFWKKYFFEEVGPYLVALGEAETEKHVRDIKRLLNS